MEKRDAEQERLDQLSVKLWQFTKGWDLHDVARVAAAMVPGALIAGSLPGDDDDECRARLMRVVHFMMDVMDDLLSEKRSRSVH